jgi:hypothetical protein
MFQVIGHYDNDSDLLFTCDTREEAEDFIELRKGIVMDAYDYYSIEEEN